MSRPRWLADRWLLGWMVVGLALRLAVVLAMPADVLPQGDEIPYLQQAARLRVTGRLETGFFVRPPLYFLYLAGLSWPAEWLGLRTRLLAALVQCVAGVATAVPVYRSAHRIAGLRAARIGAAVLMLDPTLVGYCPLLWPETLFTLLVALIFDGVAGLASRSRLHAAGLGLLTGLALLLKPVFGLFTLLLAVHWVRSLGWIPALRLVAVFGSAAALLVGPWAVRNQLRYGPRIVLENQGPYNLWVGNEVSRPGREILAEWRALPDPLTRSRVGIERGSAAIAADPLGFVARGAVRVLNLWGFEFFVVRHAIIGGYGPIGRVPFLLIFWVVQVGWAAVWLAAAAGVPRASRDRTFRLLLAYAGVFTLLVFALVATTRFRASFALPLAAAAGAGLDRALAGRWRRPEWIAVALALAVLGLSAARPVFRRVACAPWTQLAELRDAEWRFFRY